MKFLVLEGPGETGYANKISNASTILQQNQSFFETNKINGCHTHSEKHLND